MYLVNVYLIDPDPEKQTPVFTFDTLPEAIERARRWAGRSYVAFADVIGPGGKIIASYNVSGFEVVNRISDRP